ncbi:MAG: metallophosphoesterase [Planctomycetes bacterium]|nr:metallophosphoesterase [Planctomycetota bacterium]
MDRFTFVHASDLHLDTPFEGIGESSPRVAEALREASLQAWDALVDLCIQRQARILLLAGDLYDGPARGVRAQLRFLRGLQRLTDAGAHTFIAHGNHDPISGWSAIRTWPQNVHVFGHGEVEAVPVSLGGKVGAVVHGISYATAETAENLALRFRRTHEHGVHFGLLHCSVGSQPDHARYSPCSLDDLRRAGLDYWALGHIHRRQILSERTPWIAYCGNLQGRSPKASELGPKGALVGEVVGGAVQSVEFVALDRVRFEQVLVDIDGMQGLDEASRALEETSYRAVESAGRPVILRGTLAGRGQAHQALARAQALEEMLRDLRDAGMARSPWVWWDDIRDTTRGAIDRGAIVARGDFASELLRRFDRAAADPESPHHLAGPILGEMRKRLPHRLASDVLPSEWHAILRDAESLALDRLDAHAEEDL